MGARRARDGGTEIPLGERPARPDALQLRWEYGNIGQLTPVGVYPLGATPEGIHDLAGNVWEWTRSQWTDYPYHASDGRENLESPGNARRVLRGGAFNNIVRVVRCACRHWHRPDSQIRRLGFRVVVRP